MTYRSLRAFAVALTALAGASSQALAVIITPTVTIPGVVYSGSESTAFWDAGANIFVQGGDGIGVNGPTANSRGGSATGSAHASYTTSLGPPQVSASVDAASNDSFHPSTANVHITIDYFFVATGPASTVTVDLVAAGFGTVVGGGFAQEFLGVQAAANSSVRPFASPLRDWTANTSFEIFTNAVYDVRLDVQVLANAGGSPSFQSATGTVDPQFFIDPANPNADQFALFFSDSVVNAPSSPGTGTTPLPAALPLFASGLGGFVLFSRRRKRKAS